MEETPHVQSTFGQPLTETVPVAEEAANPASSSSTADLPNAVEPDTDAMSGKKQGVFLLSKFFGGKDHEPTKLGAEIETRSVGPILSVSGSAASGQEAGLASLLSTRPDAESVPPGPASNATPAPLVPNTVFAPKIRMSLPFSSRRSPDMAPLDSTRQTANRQALAQLTFGFEVTSLQLTPFFKLGFVQLKASSNVVALHLVAHPQDKDSLASAISFQIEQVQLDDTVKMQPTSNVVFVRVVPSLFPVTQELPPAFKMAGMRTTDDGKIAGACLTP